MPKAEWGVKRTCLGCGARFYDLKRDPIVCPKCDAELDIAVAQKPKRARPTAVKVDVKKTVDLIDDADTDDDTDSASDDAVLETDNDDGDVIVAKGAGDDDDNESIEEDILLDATDDDADNDADEGADEGADEDDGGKPDKK
ncbi:MAG: TIGR02300 family protein [Alphaproteobacteria bacterium]